MKKKDCIFCQIIDKSIPSNIIYEDELILAFLDIFPVSNGHTIVIPKEHYLNIEDIPNSILAKVIIIVKELSIKIRQKLNVDGYNILQNNFSAAGQAVNHCHFHIIPRTIDDTKFKIRIPRTQASEEYLQKMLDLLKR